MKNFSAALLLLLSFSLVSQELSKQQVLTFPISNELIDREHQTEKSQAGATSARIIASVNFKKSGNTLIPADSTCYIWLGNHTSIQDKTHGGANTIAADSTITYQYSNGTYAIKQRKIRDYGIANRDFYLWQNWNTTSWVNYARQRIYYNTDGNQTDFINELWNSNTSAWDSSEYWSHQYNGKNLIDNAYKSWSGGNIYNWTHSSYQFNGNNLTDEVFQTWNSTVKKLMNNSHTTYQYIANNKTGSTIQFWNIKNNNWQNSSRSEYFYSLNTLTYSLGYTWDSVNTVWNKTDSTVYKSN